VIASTVWFFDSEMERARVYGLARDYVDVQETLTTIRGRVDIAEQLRRRQLRPFPLECRFQSFTEDTPLNRVLKRAHEVAVTVPRIGSAAASRIAPPATSVVRRRQLRPGRPDAPAVSDLHARNVALAARLLARVLALGERHATR
jgi:5-methylcytosine-specific restriction enzyme subunit McrC